MAEQPPKRTGAVQGQLWGVRAADWSELQERTIYPVADAVFDRLNVGPGTRLLDVGCGAGGPTAMAAQRGAHVTGLDAAPLLLEIARKRTPTGDFRVGEIEELPFEDHAFDVVTGFNSFQYAGTPAEALRQARRVTVVGGHVAIVVWGRDEVAEPVGYLNILRKLMPAPLSTGQPVLALSEVDHLTALASEAGLKVLASEDVDCPWEYADVDTALRAMLSAGPMLRAEEHSGVEAVREAVSAFIEGHRRPDGTVRLENRFHYILTSA